jgi:hypothetical protein
VEAVSERVKDHLDAGADHVCVQVFDAGPHSMPLWQWRKLAIAMLWFCLTLATPQRTVRPTSLSGPEGMDLRWCRRRLR